MKTFKKISLIVTFLLSLLAFPMTFNVAATEPVSVKLVIGEGASIEGYQATNDATIFHEHVITFTGLYNSDLPIASKDHNTFTGWFFAENGSLIKVDKMPKVSGAIYYAFFEGDGTLANVVSPLPSQLTTTIYLDTGSTSLWNQANASFYVYTFDNNTSGDWPGKMMNLYTGNIYQATINLGFDYLIFARVSPDGEVWNQTTDLVYNLKYNTYVVTGWEMSDFYWMNTSSVIF